MASHGNDTTSEAPRPARKRKPRAAQAVNAVRPSAPLVRWFHRALSRLTDDATVNTAAAPAGAVVESRVDKASVLRREPASGTVPEEVLARFVRVGRDYHFPSGPQAFRDHGHKVTSHSENVAVIRAFVQIAAERGWQDITVTGTERFRSEVWRTGTRLGLTVRGYRPSEFEKQRFAREVAAEREPRRPARSPADRARAPRADTNGEQTYAGILLEYGPAPYQFHPQGNASYYVRIRTDNGPTLLWGKDLERALSDAKVSAGDEIRIRQAGRDTVTVKRQDLDSSGKVAGERDVKTHRNHWEIRRGRGLEPQTMSLVLKGAQLFADQYINGSSQQLAFVNAVREELTKRIGDGLAVPDVRLRQKTPEDGSLPRSL